MNTRRASWIAWFALALSVAFFGLALLLSFLTLADVLRNPARFWPEVLAALSLLAYAVVGALIATRRPRNPIGWLFCAMGLSSEVRWLAVNYVAYVAIAAPDALRALKPLAWLPINLWGLYLGLAPLVFLVFPAGQLLSRRWRIAVWLNLAAIALTLLSSGASLKAGSIAIDLPNPTALLGPETGAAVEKALRSSSAIMTLVIYVVAAASLIIRLRRARSEERQQLKWFAYATVLMAFVFVALTAIFLTPALRTLDPNAEYPGGVFLGIPFALALIAVPIGAGIAIFKYRLYDIDIIIRRTLIYGVVTASLAFAYFGSVALLQQLFRGLSGQSSELAIIVSTLAIAGLFVPLRNRVQRAIDRRFYRRTYDAARTLERFSLAVRDEVDLAELREHLLAVVQETLQPAHVSLWLKPSERERQR